MSILFKSIKLLNSLKDDYKGEEFYIPDYQRGYRWEETQAKELLDDILSFGLSSEEDNEYCLQPLVVACNMAKEKWDVVDGQQRLTTVYILLNCLAAQGFEECKANYKIEYATRSGSKDFLKKINDPDADYKNNMDYYCMHVVYETIDSWLKNVSHDDLKKFKNTLLERVKFIWYEIKSEDAQAVFTRLNVGKIKLTSSELIKALFINKSNFGDNCDPEPLEIFQGQISMKWDEIEYALQNDEFWLFIHSAEYDKHTRIDFILDMICENDMLIMKEEGVGFRKYLISKWSKADIKLSEDDAKKKYAKLIGNDDYSTFRYFNEFFKNSNQIDVKWIEEQWKIIKDCYSILNEWYHDYEIYHHIGYLIAIDERKDKEKKTKTGDHIREYLRIWGECKTKQDFKDYLVNEIETRLKKKEWIDNLKKAHFEGKNEKKKNDCYELLLLHNIDTVIMQNKKLIEDSKYQLPYYSKFPFHLYKKQGGQSRKWEIEHIRPNAGNSMEKEDDIRSFLACSYRVLSDSQTTASNNMSLLDKMEKIWLDKKIDTNSQDYKDILASLNEFEDNTLDENEKDMVWNYVLLDGGTNSEYGNKIFPVKRLFINMKERGSKPIIDFSNAKKIEDFEIKEMPETSFIPPCVKNVFTKSYTDMPSSMMNWTKSDAEKYRDSMISMLERYNIKQK